MRCKIKVRFLNYGGFRVGKVDGNKAAHGAGDLVHQATGLSEKFILRKLRDFCNLGVVNGAVVIKIIQNIADHILKSGGGGKAGALEHI